MCCGETNLDIVFSDADNVFKSDPFLPSLSLGSMIRSGKYEYIYGRKIEPGGQKIQNLNPEVYHQEPIKANTGFYYVAGGRKQDIVQRIFEISVEWCDRRPSLDDQENFWDGLVATRNKKSTEKGYVACFRHCDNDKCQGVDESMVLNYCDMSPWELHFGMFFHRICLARAQNGVISCYPRLWLASKEREAPKCETLGEL